MKKLFAIIPMFLLCLSSMGAETELTLLEAYQIYLYAENGQTGNSAELSLYMKNRNAIGSWQCTLVLPEGVTFESAELDPTRVPEGYNPEFFATPNNDGTVSFFCEGEIGVALNDYDGAVATVVVNIGSDVEPGNYTVKVTDTKLTEPGGTIHDDLKGERVFTWTIEQGVTFGTLTFDLGGAPLEYAPITVPVGDAILAPDDPEWEGHNFLGWEPEIPETMPEGGLNVVAQWEIKKFNVYVEGEGIQVENTEPEWGGTVIILVESFPDRVLEALYVNRVNVIDQMDGNTYTINNVQSDINVYAVFSTTQDVIAITQDYTPYSSAYDLDFSGSDLKAYIASGFNKATNQAVLVRVTDVPANTGVLLIGQVGESYTIPHAQTSSYFVNLFKPFVEGGWISPYGEDGTAINYVFGVVDGDPGFYSLLLEEGNIPGATANGVNLPANSAYLQLPRNFAEAAVKVGFIIEDDVIDGVSGINASDADGLIYNLAGQRISKMQKGINIVGGKKILVK